MTILTETITLKDLTFGDWISIAKHCDNSTKWAWFKWSEVADLSKLTLEEWETIADTLDYSDGWAYKSYKEYSQP